MYMSREFMSKKYRNWERSGIKNDSRAYERRSSEIAKFTFLRLLPALEIVRTYAANIHLKKTRHLTKIRICMAIINHIVRSLK